MRSLQWLLFAAVLACATQGREETDSVRSVVTGIIEADNRSDLEAVMGYYHSEAVLFPPGNPSIVGEQSIRENYKKVFASWELQIEMEIGEMVVGGNKALVSGWNRGRRASIADSTAFELNDEFAMLLEKTDKGWKIRKLWWHQSPEAVAPNQ